MTFPSFEVPTVRAFLSLGSNLGDRQAHLRRAVDQLRAGSRPAVTAVSRELMQQVPLLDYPILYWLKRLTPEITRVVDAGGHIGVKYRAFGPYLDLDRLDWVVYDLPALVRAG